MTQSNPDHPWRRAAIFAVPITALILALMLAWFTFGNRHVVFLYHHDMGPHMPGTGPFGPITRSRYWMTGFVAGGAVLALTAPIYALLGWTRRDYRPPAWGRIWTLCAAPLAIGIPVITMTTHSPTLPLRLAALTTATTLAALALALIPARTIAAQPLDALLLGLDGLALSLWLLILPSIEHAATWIAGGRQTYLLMLITLPLIGALGLAGLTLIRARLRRPMPTATHLGLAGFIAAYLGFPIVHHMLFTGGYFYITDMDNAFARAAWAQLVTFIATAALVRLTTHLRRHAVPM